MVKDTFVPQPGLPAGFRYKANPKFMQLAIENAAECVGRGDHPVGAVVTRNFWDGESSETLEFAISMGSNEVHLLGDPFAHAEIQALRRAVLKAGKLSLDQCVLYTTHECCPLCAGAVANTRLMGVVYGTSVDDIPKLREEDPEIKWRSNATRMKQIIQGRKERGRDGQFIIGGVEYEACYDLLRTTRELVDYKPPKISIEEHLRQCGLDGDEIELILNR